MSNLSEYKAVPSYARTRRSRKLRHVKKAFKVWLRGASFAEGTNAIMTIRYSRMTRFIGSENLPLKCLMKKAGLFTEGNVHYLRMDGE